MANVGRNYWATFRNKRPILLLDHGWPVACPGSKLPTHDLVGRSNVESPKPTLTGIHLWQSVELRLLLHRRQKSMLIVVRVP